VRPDRLAPPGCPPPFDHFGLRREIVQRLAHLDLKETWPRLAMDEAVVLASFLSAFHDGVPNPVTGRTWFPVGVKVVNDSSSVYIQFVFSEGSRTLSAPCNRVILSAGEVNREHAASEEVREVMES
jgi:hypothetical protein